MDCLFKRRGRCGVGPWSKLFLLAAAFAISSTTTFAAAINNCQSGGVAITFATARDQNGSGLGCTVSDDIFTNFNVASGSNGPTTNSQMFVLGAVIGTADNPTGITLTFSPGGGATWDASNNTITTVFDFNVNIDPSLIGPFQMTQVTLTASDSGIPKHDDLAQIANSICVGQGSGTCGDAANLTYFHDISSLTNNSPFVFSASTALTVHTVVTITSTNPGGGNVVTLNPWTLEFGQVPFNGVPEPATFLLLGGGLALLRVGRYIRRHRT